MRIKHKFNQKNIMMDLHSEWYCYDTGLCTAALFNILATSLNKLSLQKIKVKQIISVKKLIINLHK